MNEPKDESLTRRELLAAAVGGVALAAVGAAAGAELGGEAEAQERARRRAARQPVVFLPHGGGPWPFMRSPMFDPRESEVLARYLRSVAELRPARPRAVLMISAHWEEAVPTVMSGARPPLFYDYYGFPPETYQLSWPAPGEPRLAARTRELLETAGFRTAADAARGFDHGTFVPLKLT